MDIRQLRHFVAVVEHGNLTRASETIAISQPALTRSIKTLEEDLGVDLLERRSRGILATYAGERFYEHAKSILAECERAKSDANQIGGKLAGEVSVGIGALFASHILDQAVARLCKDHPNVTVNVFQGFFEDLLQKLSSGDIELVFTNFPLLKFPDTVSSEALWKIHSHVVAAADHPLSGGACISKLDLSQEKWAIINQPHAIDVFESLFVADGFSAPKIRARANSLTFIKAMIEDHGFISLLPYHVVERDLKEKRLSLLDVPSTPIIRQSGLIMRCDTFERRVTTELARQIRLVCEEQNAELPKTPTIRRQKVAASA